MGRIVEERMRFSIIHLFALAVFSTVIACGPAESDPTTGSDVSQQEVRDSGTSISLDSGTSSAPDAGTTSEVDSGTSADPCAPYADMARGEYTCDTFQQPTINVQLRNDLNPGYCTAIVVSLGGGIIVDEIPDPILDRHSYVRPQMTNGAAGSTATIPSFDSAYRDQGVPGSFSCHR
jgi:hypothetical protein